MARAHRYLAGSPVQLARMPSVRSFRALRPTPDLAERVASVPYDVISTPEAIELADGNDVSFLHVVRPEIDLPEGTDEHADAVYAQGAEALNRFVSDGTLVLDDAPGLFVYRLVMNGREQTGIVGLVSTADYDAGAILKHEDTRPDKEDDRTRHLLAQRAHAEPVMLTYRAHETIDDAVAEAVASEPVYDFRAKDYVQHTVWRLSDPAAVIVRRSARWTHSTSPTGTIGARRPRARPASSPTMATKRRRRRRTSWLFFSRWRTWRSCPTTAWSKSCRSARGSFSNSSDASSRSKRLFLRTPRILGPWAFYLGEDFGWQTLVLPDTSRDRVADTLDVARLAEFILEPMLNIADPRTDANIGFVGGIRGTDELERLVNGGEAEVAFSMFPTAPEDLLDVSDAGERMPPKSTWFEPKLRSGLLVHKW